VDLITVTKFLIRSFPHYRIHVYRIYGLALRMLIQYAANRTEHVMHRFAEVFSSMRCNKDEFSIPNPVKFRMSVIPLDSMLHRIDHGITSDINCARIFPFFDKVISCQLGRCEIIFADDTNSLTIEFLWIRAIDVEGAESCFNMPDRNLEIEAGQCCHKGRGGIVMDQNDIWFNYLYIIGPQVQGFLWIFTFSLALIELLSQCSHR